VGGAGGGGAGGGGGGGVGGARGGAAATGSGEADGIHHHVLFLGPLHHVLEAAVVVAEVHRRVHAVGEDEDDAPALLVQQRRDADVDRVPQRRRPFELQLGAEDSQQLVVIGCEVPRIHLD